MFNFLRKAVMLVLITIAQAKDCLLLNDQKCSVRKVIIDNDYMIFLIKLK